jgi:hypothetical protein
VKAMPSIAVVLQEDGATLRVAAKEYGPSDGSESCPCGTSISRGDRYLRYGHPELGWPHGWRMHLCCVGGGGCEHW